jgi:photosystem II stability/assembly factor-like uncharacterized protein
MNVKSLHKYVTTILGLFSLVVIPLMSSTVHARPVAALNTGTLTVTLEAGDYTLHQENGQTYIDMAQDFGSFSASGEPQLPGRTFLIALPPRAEVSHVRFETPAAVDLSGRYQLAPVEPSVTDREDVDQALARWVFDRRRAYATDLALPANVAEFRGQSQWRSYTIVQVAFQPFQYRPLSGTLRFHHQLIVTIDYRLPEEGSPAWRESQRLRGDHVLDDLIATQLVNFDQARDWYFDRNNNQPAAVNSLYDYVIVVENDAIAAAVAPFKAWKESLGHTVNTVTLPWIDANYSGVDVAEKVWNFLRDKYPAGAWGIRYVMLVGDMTIIPTRRVYYADTGWGLRSDHFYAKLAGGNTSADVWNRDGDQRWGELHDDEMTVTPDVLVGRIPLNNAADVTNAVHAMIAYEQDNGGWKHTALLAGGYNDIHNATQKTDNAVLMEYIRNHLLDPNGWAYTRLYEQSGLGTSSYSPPPDYDASNTNVVTAWNSKDHGLAILSDHGNAGGLSGVYWHHDTLTTTNQVDPGETVWSNLFLKSDVAALTNTHPPIVALLGCSSIILVGPPWPDPDQTMADPGSYTDNTGSELLAQGAAAGVVGFYAPEPYTSGWSNPGNGNMSTAGYYFAEDLVQNHYSLGWSLFETKIRYTNNFYNNNYQPFHWAFNLFGDPSMVLEGFDTSAKGTNKTIHTGAVYAYGTDNNDNGDMYVAVSTQPSNVDGTIKVYKSSDHGMTWSLWATVGHGNGILAVDMIVGDWHLDEFASQYLHIFFSDTSGGVFDVRLSLADPTTRSLIVIADEGPSANIVALSAARDPMPMPSAFNLYLAWEVTAGSSHQVRVALSTINGDVWTNQFTFENYQQPHIDAGPSQHVYLVAVADAFPNDVGTKRSIDRGASWSAWTNLTSGDSGDYHAVPVVAASTDAAIPTVWVAYNYYKPVVLGGADLHYAYSTDGGDHWTQYLPLSVERGVDELMPDMVGYRTGPSRWMNIAYDHVQSTGTQVIWRWSSGSTPNNWWAPRPVNDHDSHPAMGPQVIYSPGATATGSGVVYPGTGSPVTNLYFAAPWLTTSNHTTRVQPIAENSPDFNSERQLSPSSSSTLRPAAVQVTPSNWVATGQAPQAFRIASLVRNQEGLLFAAATTHEVNEANTGRVFRSGNDGAAWEPTMPIPDAWWLDSLLVSRSNTLLVGGTAYHASDLDAIERGIIYRSTNNGDTWSLVAEWPGATVVHALLQRANGQLVAATGPNGLILVSYDDGQHWEPLGPPASAGQIYALWETGDGTLYAGGARSDGHGVIFRFANNGWQNVGALSGVAAVYALIDQAGNLYAGVTTEAGAGQVIRSLNNGATWESLPGLPASKAVRALLSVSGTIYAGLDVGGGPYTTFVYKLPPGVATWQPAGTLFMADAVNGFLPTPGGAVYAASGDTYGVVFRAESLGARQLYLPLLVLRNSP